MLDQSKGKLFTADERGQITIDWFKSYHTFNFGTYQNKNKTPFGPLYVLNDDTLAGGRSFVLHVEEDSEIILLPTVGVLTYKDNLEHENLIEVGQVQWYDTPKNTVIEIGNPYGQELINFIHLWIYKSSFNPKPPQIVGFNLQEAQNKLVPLSPSVQDEFEQSYSNAFIGRFDGRKEISYPITDPKRGLFVFVLEGAFEVQHRLVETRDGLAIWDAKEVEIEALSNGAVLLVLEVPVI